MPELAEVEFFRRRWDIGLGQKINRVLLHPKAGIFRKTSAPSAIIRHLTGATLVSSETAAKQMLFKTDALGWLGIHLGMTGEISAQPANYTPQKHDHLVLAQEKQCLVFTDPRMFGRVQFHVGPDAPAWWSSIAPAILSSAFTVAAVATFLHRRARAPIKAVLLMQQKFPGIGNWMADEILWRSALHPKRLAGSLTPTETETLHRETRWVVRHALQIIGTSDALDLPDPPANWLFRHRWADGGRCPQTDALLLREQIGGRTTCWSPARQKL